MARDFIIKPDGVVTHTDRARLGQETFDFCRKFMLGHTALKANLRRDACQQTRLRVRQVVFGGLAIQHDGLAHFIELSIGANARELRRTLASGVQAEGFVVVP